MPPATGKRKRSDTATKRAVSKILKKARTVASKQPKGRFGFRSGFTQSKLGEWKFNDIAVNNTNQFTTANAYGLNLIAQGTDANQRIGRDITMKRITWRMQLVRASGGTASTAQYRIMLVYDKQTNGVAATYNDVTVSQGNVVYSALQPINLNWRERFVVLKDYHGVLSQFDDTGMSKIIKGNWKGSLPVRYQGAGGTIADVNTGALYLMVVNDQATGAGMAFTFITRVRYVDN